MIIKPRSANFFARLFVGIGLIVFILINLSFFIKAKKLNKQLNYKQNELLRTK